MHKKSGFSLIELLVAMAIIAIVISVGLPGLLNYRQKANLGKAARDIYGGLQRAKIEAARNNRFCVFRFGDETVGTETYGFVVFLDNDNDYEYDDGVDDFVNGYKPSDYPGAFLDTAFGGGDGMTFPDIDGAPTIAFAPDGLPKNLDGTLSSGNIRFNDHGENGRQISVSLVGNVQISQYEVNP